MPVVSLGSQASRSAVVTNQDRCIVWNPVHVARYLEEKRNLQEGTGSMDALVRALSGMHTSHLSFFKIVPPIDSETGRPEPINSSHHLRGERLYFAKYKFGHNNFFLIDSKKRLYSNTRDLSILTSTFSSCY